MKNMKKILALLVAVMVLIASMSVAFAAGPEYKITVTPSGEGVSIDGKEFKAYKLFDATYSTTSDAVAYSINVDSYFYKTEAVKTILDNYFTFTDTADANVKTVTPKAGFDVAQAYALTEALNGKLPSTEDAKATAADDKAEITVPSAGYYIVTGEGVANEGGAVIAATAVTTAKPTASIRAKIDAPSIDKEVDTPIDTAKHENQKSIGDTVTYTVKTKVPDMTGYTQKYFFVVTDTLSKGLTLVDDYAADNAEKKGGFTITLGDKTLVRGTDYVIEKTDYSESAGTTITIVFKNFIQYKGTYNAETQVWDNSKEGSNIVITYNAILNDNAVLGNEGNPNDVNLEYSNNPNDEGEGQPDNPDKPRPGDATGKTPNHTTKTYVTGIELLKIGDNNVANKLKDVEFVVTGTALNDIKETTYERYVKVAEGTGDYYLLKDGSYTTTAIQNDPDQDGYNGNLYAETAKNYKLEAGTTFSKTSGQEVTYKVKTDANGLITLSGLGEGTYVIKEIKTNDGYNLLENPVTIVVTAQTKVESEKTVFDTWKFKKDSDAESTTVNSNNRFEFTVNNNKGTVLPSTGGMGTTILYVGGSILVILAAVLLITKRRMNAND